MSIALVSTVLPFVGNVLDRFFPNKEKKEEALREIEKTLINNAAQIGLETIKTNQVEAAHRSVFVAGWRPGIGWTCALGIFWMFIGHPIASWVLLLLDIATPLPAIDKDILLELTFGMLGIAGLRTFEKLKGVAK